ncbi:MAG: DUF433 domain-containing protein [Bacteroidales bacterium]|nr:DUF433 domain-containing protein [Bacteroidales bacterium]
MLEFPAAGESVDEILYQYSSLKKDGIKDCLNFVNNII